jgi:ABC-type branched-subunit amino acid transport system ATPase component
MTASVSSSLPLSVEHLGVSYRGIRAVSDVNFDIPAGGCVAMVGANGAGKTSTLHAIGGLTRARRATKIRMGEIVLSDISDPSDRARIGLGHVLEDRHVFQGLTVRENLDLAWSRRTQSGDSEWGLDLALSLFPDLGPLMNRKAGTLSGGQQQFLAISRAIAAQPKVLMLDEPTNGLAPRLVDAVVDVIRDLRQRDLTVLVVEQRLEVAQEVSDLILVLSHGRVVHETTPDDPELGARVEAAYLS